MPLRVYLDSSDYSIMSDCKRLTPALSFIKTKLLEYAASGKIEFYYSAAHICEMAPVSSKVATLAEGRANLLVRLCGTKALVSFDKLFHAELFALVSRTKVITTIYSNNGDWFPAIQDFMAPITSLDRTEAFDGAVRDLDLNRTQRRELSRKAYRGGKPNKFIENAFSSSNEQSLKEVLSRYPMREQDALVLQRYVQGRESKENAELAFCASLRDPSWMMKWFESHHEKLTPLIEWVRLPSKTLQQRIKAIADDISRIRTLPPSQMNEQILKDVLNIEARQNMKQKSLLSTCLQLAESIDLPMYNIDADSILEFSPGISTSVNTAVDSFWSSLSKNPRLPKASDFVDVIHAMYAPYVDIFRTDAYMAPLVDSNTKKYGTTVVGNLLDIIEVIEKKLGH